MFFIKLIKKIFSKRKREEKKPLIIEENISIAQVRVCGYFDEGHKLSLTEEEKNRLIKKIAQEIADEGLYEFSYFPDERKYEISVSVNAPSNKGGGL